MKVSKLMAAAGVVAAGLVGFGGVADAAPSTTSVAVACVNGDGVMSLTLTNTAATGAEFVVTNPQTFVSSVFDLDPGVSQLVTIAGLSDGAIVVPIRFDSNDASVTAQIACDLPACTDGVSSIVTDDSGVQHQACVASATATLVVTQRALLPRAQQTAPSTIVLPATGAGTGGLIIAAVLVGSGSLVSLLSRRRPSGARKGFRRRGVTP